MTGMKKFWAGIGVSFLFLVLFIRKIHFNQLVEAFQRIDYQYLLAAIVSTFAGYYARALRWEYLLMPLKKCSKSNVYSITIIGLMVNGLFHARMGELAQLYARGSGEARNRRCLQFDRPR